MKTCEPQFDVAIVGFGPSGATLANLLGQLNIKTVILDKEANAYHLPRAVQFDDEIMRVFQNIGLSKEIEKITRFNPGMRFIDYEGHMLLDWPRPTEVSRQAWHTSYRFHQPDLESILREGLKRYSNVSIITQALVTSISQNVDSCEIVFKQQGKDSLPSLSTKYVVGCDGARSFTRSTIDSQLHSFGFMERWLVVDVLLNTPKPELGDYTLQYCVPSRPCTYVRGPNNRRRWEITVKEHERAEDISQPERVWELLSQWLKPHEASLERTAVYTFESSVATRWRQRRVMLAGDAAHLTPPFMGQGMCAGIRDVSNLAWKLAHCCQSDDQNSLLDSYQLEREPHVTEYINTAIRLGGLINTSGDAESLHTALRQPDGSTKMKSIAPGLGKALAVANTTMSGTLASQPLTESGTRLDEKSLYKPLLLCDSTLWIQTNIEKSQLLYGATLVEVGRDGSLRNYLDELGARAVMLRADRYILGTASNTEELIQFST